MVNFSVGDIVQLKSGGPIMTVESVDEEGLSCIWFADMTTVPLRTCFVKEVVETAEIGV